MWIRFNGAARRVILQAHDAARSRNELEVDVTHLLLAAIDDVDDAPAQILAELGVDIDALRLKVESELASGRAPHRRDLRLSTRAKRVIDLAYDEVRTQAGGYSG